MQNIHDAPRRQSNGAPINSLRLNSGQIRDIHSKLDGSFCRQIERELRGNERFRYRTSDPIELQITHPGGSVETYQVQPRNISASGMGLLHGGFIHPGSVCFVTLTGTDQQHMGIYGRVARCRLVSGRVHEIGIAFDVKIDITALDVEPETPLESPALSAAPDVPQMLRSDLWRKRSTRAMIPNYVDRMKALIQQLARSLCNGRMIDATQYADELRSAATSYGYPMVAETAERLTNLLRWRSAPQVWKAEVLRLAALCDAAQRGLEAA